MTEGPQPKPKRRRPGCLAKLAITGFSVVLALVLCEIGLRVFGDEVLPNPIGPRYLYVHDDVIGVALNPGFEGRFALHGEFDVPISISSQGFRDREFGKKQPGVKRVLCLGDSFGFGFGVRAEDTYAKVLESRLNGGKTEGRKFEVLNAGASGIGILEMTELMKRASPWFEPDVVLATFFFGNDLGDIEHFPQHTVRGGIVLTPHFSKIVDGSAWLRFCFGWSNLALLIERARFNLSTGANLGSVPRPAGDGFDVRPILVAPNAGDAEELKWFQNQVRMWGEFEKHLASLKKECEKVGAKLVLMSIPQEFQTVEAVWEKAQPALAGRAAKDYDRFHIGNTLKGICGRVQLPFLDLVPGFRATPPKKTRYFALNKHFNEEGNAFAAQLIERFLKEQGLL